MKTYKETKQAVKELILAHGLDGLLGQHIISLYNEGHTGTNVQNAISFFQYSPQAAKYRN
jgi:hypothetical protein